MVKCEEAEGPQTVVGRDDDDVGLGEMATIVETKLWGEEELMRVIKEWGGESRRVVKRKLYEPRLRPRWCTPLHRSRTKRAARRYQSGQSPWGGTRPGRGLVEFRRGYEGVY